MRRQQAPDGYMTMVETAKEFGVSVSTARSWTASGMLAYIMSPSGKHFVPRSEVARMRRGDFLPEEDVAMRRRVRAIMRQEEAEEYLARTIKGYRKTTSKEAT